MANEEMQRLRDCAEKEWYRAARKQTSDTIGDFVKEVMSAPLDYGTVCSAVAACALAAANAANNEPNGGITGFQAGFVMWGFVREWLFPNNKTALKIVDYDDLLYPQYEYKFKPVISKSTWEAVQQEAAKRLSETEYAHPAVKAHWQSIVNGVIPFGMELEQED